MSLMKMRSVMKMTSWWLLLLGLAVSLTAATGPGSCVGRCGEVFTRGQQCACDSSCLLHNECCKDFDAVCINAQSCRGRCAESFRRGRLCECDPDCIRYSTCCHDYQLHCDASGASVPASSHRTLQPLRAAAAGNRKSQRSRKRSNSESEEWFADTTQKRRSCSQSSGSDGRGGSSLDLVYQLTDSSSGPALPAAPTNQLQNGMSHVPASLLPVSVPSSSGGAPHAPARGSTLPGHGALSLGPSSPQGPSGPGVSAGKVNIQLVLSDGGMAPSGPSQGLNSPAGSGNRPSTLQDVAQALGLSLADVGSDGPGTGMLANYDLCNDSPIDGLTALSNGTILIFKGEHFWSVDPVSRSVSSPQSITDTLGVPAPIDTVFTRCNCQGNTYIIKGDQVWRLDGNMMVEPGYPQPLAFEFSGLTGGISAALPLPATRGRPETVYFFKGGDTMQKYTFPPGSAPSCSRKSRTSYTSGTARQAGGVLSGEISLKVSLKGFPSPVTCALSMPNPQRSDGYEHYVFSGPLFFNIRISGDLPALAKPHPSAAFTAPPTLPQADSSSIMAAQSASPLHPANSIMRWLQCP